MNASPSAAAEQELQRIDALIAALDSLPDAEARESARQLLEVILDVHGAGLQRLLELVADSGEGAALLERIALDEGTQSILLLHDLHPHSMEERVRHAVGTLRTRWSVRGLSLEVLGCSSSQVRVRVQCGAPSGGASDARSLADAIRTTILDAAPEVQDVLIEGLEDLNSISIPLASIGRRAAVPSARG